MIGKTSRRAWPPAYCALGCLLVCGPTDVAARRATQPRPARADPLDPLYKRIVADLNAGKPLVITVHVALCSNKQIWCGSRKLGRGHEPRTNLYWGGAAGLRNWFDHRARGFKRVFLDSGDGRIILERAVYRYRVKWLSKRWKRMGVTRPFDLYLVGLGYRGKHIGRALGALIRQVSTDSGSTLKLPGGPTLAIGGKSHVVGYAGHNHLMDVKRFLWPRFTRTQHVGYFMLACMSAQYVSPRLTRTTTHALLLTRILMYPGAFTIEGLARGLSYAAPQRAVFQNGARYYAKYSKTRYGLIRRLFTHDARRRFQKRYPRKP